MTGLGVKFQNFTESLSENLKGRCVSSELQSPLPVGKGQKEPYPLVFQLLFQWVSSSSNYPFYVLVCHEAFSSMVYMTQPFP